MNHPPAPPIVIDPDLDRARQELVGLLNRLTGDLDGSMPTAVPGLFINRLLHSGGFMHAMQTPAFALIAQGTKRIFVGDETYVYDPLHYLLSAIDVPIVSKVCVSSPDQPYMSLRIDLDLEIIGELIHNATPSDVAENARGLCVQRLEPSLLDAVLRLIRLLDSLHDIAVLAPLIKREILRRLLTSSQGARLHQLALQDSQTQRIARVIRLLREQFARPLRIEAIARDVHMSTSSLHHHFKAVTAMSPIQYQKQLRLQEARRLLFLNDLDVIRIAQRVGYESPSQFSREYSRLFGTTPSHDRKRWTEEGRAA